MIFTRSSRGLWSYNTRNLRLIRFFEFWDIQLYMTKPPNSGELETVSVESTAIYLLYEVNTTDCTKWKQMLVINLRI